MKGVKSIELNGQKINLRFTAGVLEDFQEYAEREGLEGMELEKIKHQRVLLALMEKYAGDDWKEPDVLESAIEDSVKYKNMEIGELMKAVSVVGELELGNAKGAKAPKKRSQKS